MVLAVRILNLVCGSLSQIKKTNGKTIIIFDFFVANPWL